MAIYPTHLLRVPRLSQSLSIRVPNKLTPSSCQPSRKRRTISCTSLLASIPLVKASFQRRKQSKIKSASYARMYGLYDIFRLLMTSRETYGTNSMSTLPSDVVNFVYGSRTGNSNLRRHLYKIHPTEYDEAVLKYKWPFKLSTEARDESTHNPRNIRDGDIPSFSPAAFLEHLVRFVVADDQVSSDDLMFFLSQVFSRFVL